MRPAARFISTLVLLVVSIGFLSPTLFIAIWPWTLTPPITLPSQHKSPAESLLLRRGPVKGRRERIC